MKKDTPFRLLKASEVAFQRTKGGFLSLRVGKRDRYPRVHLYRSFPLSRNAEYISVRDKDDKEIGIIEDLAELPPKITRLLLEELERRYFTPTIREIKSLKQEFGYTYWEVVTDSGFCRFTVKMGDNTVRYLTDSTLLVFDVDGNRFELPEYEGIDKKHLKIVETLL
jgi:hypothetical protein